MTLERPGFGHVVAKTGQFAGKPTCSTWKAMGLSHDKLDAAFGHSHFSEWSEDELEYFYESMARSVSFLCKHPVRSLERARTRTGSTCSNVGRRQEARRGVVRRALLGEGVHGRPALHKNTG